MSKRALFCKIFYTGNRELYISSWIWCGRVCCIGICRRHVIWRWYVLL